MAETPIFVSTTAIGHCSKAIRAWKPNWKDGMIRRCGRRLLRSCNIMCILQMRWFLCIFHTCIFKYIWLSHIISYTYHTFDIRFFMEKNKMAIWFKIKLPKAHKHICYVFSTFSFSHHPIKHVWCCWGQYLWGHNTNPLGYKPQLLRSHKEFIA